MDATSLTAIVSAFALTYLQLVISVRHERFIRLARVVAIGGNFLILLGFFYLLLSHGSELPILHELGRVGVSLSLSIVLVVASLGQVLQAPSTLRATSPRRLLLRGGAGAIGLLSLAALIDYPYSTLLARAILVTDLASTIVSTLPLRSVLLHLHDRIGTLRLPRRLTHGLLPLCLLLISLLGGSMVVTRIMSQTLATHTQANSSSHSGLGLQQVSAGPSLSNLGFSTGILPLQGASELPLRIHYFGHSQVGNPNLQQKIDLQFTAALGRTKVGQLSIRAIGTLQPDGSFSLSKSLAILSFRLGHQSGRGTATYISSQAVRGQIFFAHHLRYDFTMSINTGPSSQVSGVLSLIHVDGSDSDGADLT
jgi:hypothetical protein